MKFGRNDKILNTLALFNTPFFKLRHNQRCMQSKHFTEQAVPGLRTSKVSKSTRISRICA